MSSKLKGGVFVISAIALKKVVVRLILSRLVFVDNEDTPDSYGSHIPELLLMLSKCSPMLPAAPCVRMTLKSLVTPFMLVGCSAQHFIAPAYSCLCRSARVSRFCPVVLLSFSRCTFSAALITSSRSISLSNPAFLLKCTNRLLFSSSCSLSRLDLVD